MCGLPFLPPWLLSVWFLENLRTPARYSASLLQVTMEDIGTSNQRNPIARAQSIFLYGRCQFPLFELDSQVGQHDGCTIITHEWEERGASLLCRMSDRVGTDATKTRRRVNGPHFKLELHLASAFIRSRHRVPTALHLLACHYPLLRFLVTLSVTCGSPARSFWQNVLQASLLH